jgi:hypothetical protein
MALYSDNEVAQINLERLYRAVIKLKLIGTSALMPWESCAV